MVKETDHLKTVGPVRTCLGCRKRDLKKNLLRVVFNDGQLIVDEKHNYQARGGYVHDNEKCLEKVRSFSLWERSLKLGTGGISIKEWPKKFFNEGVFIGVKKKGIRL